MNVVKIIQYSVLPLNFNLYCFRSNPVISINVSEEEWSGMMGKDGHEKGFGLICTPIILGVPS